MANSEAHVLSYLRETTNLAAQGLYRCRYCRETKPLAEGLVVTWGGTIFFAMCPSCFPGRPIVIQESTLSDGKRGVKVGFLNESDRPQVQLVRGMHEANQFVPHGALARREKKEL